MEMESKTTPCVEETNLMHETHLLEAGNGSQSITAVQQKGFSFP